MEWLPAYLIAGVLVVTIHGMIQRRGDNSPDLAGFFTLMTSEFGGFGLLLGILLWPLIVLLHLLAARSLASSSANPATPPDPAANLVGRSGIVVGGLRPAGRVQVGEQLVDARSSGQFIEAGKSVRLIRREMGVWQVEE